MTQNFKNILDKQENKTAELSSRTHRPIADYIVTHLPGNCLSKLSTAQVCPLYSESSRTNIWNCNYSTTASKTDLNKCLLAQYESQLGEVKAQLSLISRDVASLEPEDKDLSKLEDDMYKFHFDLSLKLHRSLCGEDKSSTSLNDKTGVKLPRLEVPSFNGNFVN